MKLKYYFIKFTFGLFFIAFLSNLVHAQTTMVWQKCFGGTTTNMFRNMCKTSDGNYFLMGTYNSAGGSFDSIYGGTDIGLIKIDTNGNEIWAKHYGSVDNDGAASIIKGEGNKHFILGWTKHYGFLNFHGYSGISNDADAYVICIDENGNTIWEHCYGGFRNYNANSFDTFVDGVFLDSDYLYAVGYTKNSFGGEAGGNYDPDTTSNATTDILVCKINKDNGSVVHSQRFGGSKGDSIVNIKVDEDNNLLIIGGSGSTDYDVPINYGGCDAWMLKIDSSLNVLDSKIWGGLSNDMLYDVFPRKDKGYDFFGWTSNHDTLTGNLNFIVPGFALLMHIQTDSNHQSVLQNTFACGIGNMNFVGAGGNHVIRTKDNGYIVMDFSNPANCLFYPYTDGHTIFVKIDSLGNQEWIVRYGCTTGNGVYDYPRCIIGLENDKLIVGSQGHTDTNNFCSTPGVNPYSMWNIYKLKINPVITYAPEILNNQEMLFYPNPANDILFIQGLNNSATAEIYNISGALVKSENLIKDNIDIHSLSPGMYFIKLSTGEVSVVSKFVKE